MCIRDRYQRRVRGSTTSLMRLLLVTLLVAWLGFAAPSIIFHDDFSDCQTTVLGGSKWNLVTRQWGGDVNGGVAPGNVKCGEDSGHSVLVLEAHGDGFTGDGPTGFKRSTSTSGDEFVPRGPDDEWSHAWGYSGYTKKCSPFCDRLRVGAAVQSKFAFDQGGTFEVEMKTCGYKGALASAWLFNYTEIGCKVSEGEACSAVYTAACCTSSPCTINNDKCQGYFISNKEIDMIETPTAGAHGVDLNDPANIEFTNARFSSYTAMKACTSCACKAGHTICEEHDYTDTGIDLSQGYHQYKIDWDSGARSVKFYVDGHLTSSMSGDGVVPDYGSLWLGTWFPNAWAGTPDFDTCQVMVRSVTASSSSPTPPTPPTPTPPTPTPATCDWQKALVRCEADSACSSWIKKQCTHGEAVTGYCSLDKGYCHFSGTAPTPTPPTPPTPTPPTPTPPTPPTPTPPTPTPPTPPTPTPPSPGCDWATTVVTCKADSDCQDWVSKHCKPGQVSEDYCRTSAGTCHFTGGSSPPCLLYTSPSPRDS
eukprot:TRINITY_DN9140_c0_g1_i8.p1 TRINITY_DN9140_c0_g1~~TRINITY_DN9140_c0_g1_i8.p1  ORF type:complete len:534 (-),score=105.55 TRINITY_DN9140_c0_g1_i8:160-1761(-)